MTDRQQRDRVVVGVDGSPGSRRALGYALEEAHRRAVPLVVVTVAYWDNPGIELFHPGREQLLGWGEHLLSTMLDDVDPATVQVPVERVVVEGHPAQALVDQADGALALVVGRRGRGGLRSLLGSVSHQVVVHASVPVIVVPPAATVPS